MALIAYGRIVHDYDYVYVNVNVNVDVNEVSGLYAICQ